MRLVSNENELQMVAAMQAARTAPGNQLAAGMASSGAAPIDFSKLIAAAAPMAGGGGGAPAPQGTRRAPLTAGSPSGAAEEEEGFSWGGAGQGALQYGTTGAAIGTKILPGWGTAVGGVVGALAGGIAGGLS